MKKDLLFDLDDTLVSLNSSREVVVLKIFSKYFGKNFNILEIKELIKQNRREDYIGTINEVLKHYGLNININVLTNDFVNEYLLIAKNTEKLIINEDILVYLKNKYNLYIVTGRPKKFYNGVWDKKFKQYFSGVVCQDDFKDIQRKPAPDIIIKTIKKYNLNVIYYVGNDIKDIMASHNANIKSIFVKHTNKNLKEVEKYKPEIILENINDIISSI